MKGNKQILRISIPIIVKITISLCLPIPGYANQCAYKDPKVILATLSTTFVGEVISASPNLVKMRVKKLYKGRLGDEVDLIYPSKPGIKDKKLSMLKAGESYLISTESAVEPGPDKTPRVVLKRCEIAQNLKKSDDLIKWLDSPEFKSSETSAKPK